MLSVVINTKILDNNTVLWRETHLATADKLTMNQLSCKAKSFLDCLNREHFNAP